MYQLLPLPKGNCTLIFAVRASRVTQTMKNLPVNTEDTRDRFSSWVERSPGEGNGYPLQDSCLGNPLDRGACLSTAPGVTNSQIQLNHYFEFPNSTTGG